MGQIRRYLILCQLVIVLSSDCAGSRLQPLDSKLLYYEPVYYDTHQLHRHHLHKHQTKHEDPLVIKFNAYGRSFNLHLQPDRSHRDVVISHRKKTSNVKLNHLYTGYDKNTPGSSVHAAIIEGTFQATLKLSPTSTYHIVPSSSIFHQPTSFPSVIYADTDYHWNRTMPDFNTADIRENIEQNLDITLEQSHRKKRENRDSRQILIPDRSNKYLNNKVCTLKLTTDQTVWRHLIGRMNNSEVRATNEITYLLSSHVRELNSIFRDTTFTIHKDTKDETSVTGIQFEIKKIVMMTDDDCTGDIPSVLCMEKINGEDLLYNFLDMESVLPDYDASSYIDEEVNDYDYDKYNVSYNYDYLSDIDPVLEAEEDYCISFLFTARILFSNNRNSLLGLTIPASPQQAGGICEVANKGFVTLLMETDQYLLPPPMTKLVFVHEIAHSFGALHDNTDGCQGYGLKQEPQDGFYLMHSIAQNGQKPNNRKLSSCSKDKISTTLSLKKHVTCFKETLGPVCGNGIVEEGEQCDCGSKCHLDSCCHSKTEDRPCLLKVDAVCSPSQGPCCDKKTCDFIPSGFNVTCQNKQQCVSELHCDGERYGAKCPPAKPEQVRPDDSFCYVGGNVQVCKGGSCNTSICSLIGWEECQLTNQKDKMTMQEKEELCYVGCQQKLGDGIYGECVSTHNEDRVTSIPELRELLDNVSISTTGSTANRGIHFPIGTPCNMMTGYCDVFMRCRGVDPDTPLVNLKRCVKSGECILAVKSFVLEYWYVVLLGCIAGITVFTALVKCFTVHTKSNNPYLEQKHPHRTVRQSVHSVRRSVSFAGGTLQRQMSSFRSSFTRRGETTSGKNERAGKLDALGEHELETLNTTAGGDNSGNV